MLLVLLPTVTGYYKGDSTVKDRKFAHDKEAAEAAAQKQRTQTLSSSSSQDPGVQKG
jgi:hypothetical protein